MENVNTVSENGAVAIEDLFTEDEKEVWEEILDYAIWEFCFDVHRAVKLNYAFLDPDLDPNYDSEEETVTCNGEAENDGQKSKKINDNTVLDCPNCTKPTSTVKFGAHLPKCLGLAGRAKTREANKKGMGDTEENESENVPSTSSGLNKRRKSKKRRNKKLQKAKAEGKTFPRLSSEINGHFETVPYEEKEAFFNEECDAVSETSKSFINSDKCAEDTDEEMEAIQTTYLRVLDDANDDEINADTISNSDISGDTGSNSEISGDTGSNSEVSGDSGSNEEINIDTASNSEIRVDTTSNSEISSDAASKDDSGYFAT